MFTNMLIKIATVFYWPVKIILQWNDSLHIGDIQGDGYDFTVLHWDVENYKR